MKTIIVKTLGDRWLNPQEVQAELSQDDGTGAMVLDLRSEGPDLKRLGIIDAVRQHCENSHRDKDSVWIKSWSNDVQIVPFKRSDKFLMSHCFWMSDYYKIDVPDVDADAKLFGFFVGRRTLPRLKIMKDLWDHMPDRCLFSLMNSRARFMPEDHDHTMDPGWIDTAQMVSFEDWAQSPPIASIDGHWTHEHFMPDHNTNQDLLNHYHRFHIEIVTETFALGESFFPTEKTVRPMIGGKPMLIHGPKNFLQHLRELGFRTWGDYWDESYDDLEGAQRWHAMFQVIKDIKNVPDRKISLHNLRCLDQINSRHRPR